MPANKREIIAIVTKKGNEPIYDKPITIRLPKDVMDALAKWENDIEDKTGKRRKRSKIIVELLRDALRLKGQKQD